MPHKFQSYLIISVATHLLVIFCAWFSPEWLLRPLAKDYKVTWIQLSKGDGGMSLQASYKNSKTLPSSTLREQKKAIRELAVDQKGMDLKTHLSKTKDSVVQKWSHKRSAEKSGLNIEKKTAGKSQIEDALARIDQQLEQREVDMSVAQTTDGETGQSPFGSHTGTQTDPALIAYYNAIKRKINREWLLAKGDFTGSLVAKIIVLIDAHGNVIRSFFKNPSGDGSFDVSAMRAIKNSTPFPIPPDGIRNEALNEGFLIEFNPMQVTGRLD